MRNDCLELRSISKRFGGVVTAKDITTTIEGGTCTAIVGPNGTGKTTLLNIVTGLIEPDIGEVYWQGRLINGLSLRDRSKLGIGRMFQDLRLFSSLTVWENLAAAMLSDRQARGCSRDDRIREVLADVRLEHRAAVRVSDLSYAEQKLTALGRLIVAQPALLLLDEPASGLDRKSLETVVDIVSRLRGAGVGVVIVEHNLEIVSQLATRALLLEAGRVAGDGPPVEVFSGSDFGRVFFSMHDATTH